MVGNELSILLAVEVAARRDKYEAWLGDHEVSGAGAADEAIGRLTADVDVVLVDVEGPDRHGLEVARELAAAADPYVLLACDTPADSGSAASPVHDWLRRPVDEGALQSALDRYRTLQDYEAGLEELYGLTARLATIEARHSSESLVRDERYRRLQWLVEEQRAEVDEALRATATDWTTTFASLVPDRPGRGRSGHV